MDPQLSPNIVQDYPSFANFYEHKIIQIEMQILLKLSFNTSRILAPDFFQIFASDLNLKEHGKAHSFAKFLLAICKIQQTTLAIPVDLLAFACVYLTNRLFAVDTTWPLLSNIRDFKNRYGLKTHQKSHNKSKKRFGNKGIDSKKNVESSGKYGYQVFSLKMERNIRESEDFGNFKRDFIGNQMNIGKENNMNIQSQRDSKGFTFGADVSFLKQKNSNGLSEDFPTNENRNIVPDNEALWYPKKLVKKSSIKVFKGNFS